MQRQHCEPNLTELLNDPLTWVLMARDGISREALSGLLKTVAARRDKTFRHALLGAAADPDSLAGRSDGLIPQ